ncbi:MAG TPA: radical SAM protein [Patescibacteria group bacterium]|nr:radical SAM protein [Patescibacteria group bacterium]
MDKKILFVDVWGGIPMYPSLSIAYLSTIAKQEGYRAEIISPNIVEDFSEEMFREYLELDKPEYVAFTLFTTQVFNAYRLIKVAKLCGCITIVGGPHVSSLGGEEVKEECPEIDFLFEKESESTFREFLKGNIKNNIIKMDKFSEINSISFPDRSAYKEEGWQFDSNYLKKPVHILISSRGCPYSCNFCYKDTFGRNYRQRSVDNVLDECEEIMKAGGKELYFIDDLFTLDKKWIIKFCQEKIRRGINLPFKCLGRADKLDDAILYNLKQAGCHTIAIGVESGNQEVVNWINKNLKLEDVEKCVKLIHKYKINVESYFIIGHRIDNEKTIDETIEFARKINSDFPRFFLFSPYPGSRVWNELPIEMKEKYWIKGTESDLRSINPISICEVSPQRLVELWHKAHDWAYSYRYIKNIIREFFDKPFERIWFYKLKAWVGYGVFKLHKRRFK